MTSYPFTCCYALISWSIQSPCCIFVLEDVDEYWTHLRCDITWGFFCSASGCYITWAWWFKQGEELSINKQDYKLHHSYTTTSNNQFWLDGSQRDAYSERPKEVPRQVCVTFVRWHQDRYRRSSVLLLAFQGRKRRVTGYVNVHSCHYLPGFFNGLYGNGQITGKRVAFHKCTEIKLFFIHFYIDTVYHS